MFPPGIHVLRRNLLGDIENSMESVDSCLGKRVQESWFLVALLGGLSLAGENKKLTVTWSNSRLHNELLGIKKFTVIWPDSRLCSSLLERMKLN